MVTYLFSGLIEKVVQHTCRYHKYFSKILVIVAQTIWSVGIGESMGVFLTTSSVSNLSCVYVRFNAGIVLAQCLTFRPGLLVNVMSSSIVPGMSSSQWILYVYINPFSTAGTPQSTCYLFIYFKKILNHYRQN